MARLRGVNLGGWLVLEKWMTPSLFAGLSATDETSWCVELGSTAAGRLREHWRNFVRAEDIAWLADTGINAVRIPVGHWILGPPYPYHARYGPKRHPFVTGGIDVLDHALDLAAQYGLVVILDLHAAAGCQNGFDNGGMKDVCDWHTQAQYMDHSVDLLGRLAARYRAHPALRAIEVLNEPRWDVPTPLLQDYYVRAAAAIRGHCSAGQVAVVFHDGFRPHREFGAFFRRGDFADVWYDVHRYQCFEPADLALDMAGHLHKASVLWREEARRIQDDLGIAAIVGEWSLGLDLEVVSLWAQGPFDHALSGQGEHERDRALREYASAQLAAFADYHGWFFWSYRTETTPAWSFRDCVGRGWLPARFS